ncbi:MAG: histidine kinase dimerization/phospho-acceptor domain-containing protein, partial [Phycisphaerae bacterium]
MDWARFKRFWMAEEVPRWFGFSIVVTYLVGLGAVGYFGVAQARQRTAEYAHRSGQYAISCLLDRLQLQDGESNDKGVAIAGLQRELYDFATYVPTEVLRIVDHEGRITASIDVAEVGTYTSEPPLGGTRPTTLEETAIKTDRGLVTARLYNAPIMLHRASAQAVVAPDAQRPAPGAVEQSVSTPPGESEACLYLEARLPADPAGGTALVSHSGTLTVVLVAMGALFGLYRCLRSQLRSASRIAERLRARRHRLAQDLASLRLADTSDALITAWNELVDYAQSALDAVQRKEANTELAKVLERSSGGALAAAINALPDGIIYITDEVRFEYMNSAARRLFGWDAQEAKNASLPDARASGVGADVLNVLRDALSHTGSFQARSVPIEAKEDTDAADSTYRVWVIPLQRAHRQGECVVVIRDVSQHVRADRAREDFVTQVTHELRTPLTNIRAYAETLSSGVFDDPNIITECYNVITKETRRLSRLIEDILSVSQLEVGA